MSVQAVGNFITPRGKLFRSLRFVPLVIYRNSASLVARILEGEEKESGEELALKPLEQYYDEAAKGKEEKLVGLRELIDTMKKRLREEGVTKKTLSRCDVIIARRGGVLSTGYLGKKILILFFKKSADERFEDYLAVKRFGFVIRRFGIASKYIIPLLPQMTGADRQFSTIYILIPSKMNPELEIPLAEVSSDLGMLAENTLAIFNARKGMEMKLRLFKQRLRLAENERKIWETSSIRLRRRLENKIREGAFSVTLDAFERETIRVREKPVEQALLYLLLGLLGGGVLAAVGTKLLTAEWHVTISEETIAGILILVAILAAGVYFAMKWWRRKK